MNDKATTAVENKPGYMYQFSADLGSGRVIALTGNFPVAASKEDMDKEFDKVRSAMDRQQAKSALPAIQAELDGIDATLNALKQDFADAEARFKGKTLPTAEQQAQVNIKTSIRNLEAKRAKVLSQFERAKAEAE